MASAPSNGGTQGSAFNRTELARLRSAVLSLVRTRFLQAVSHDLRTPLTSVLGYAMTLEKHWHELDEPTKRESVRAILDQSRELRRVIENVLEVARIDLEKITIEDLDR